MITDQEILNIFNEIFKSNYTHLNISRDDVRQWDSMKHAELIIKIQKKFRVNFKAKDLGSIKTIADLKNILISRIEKE